MGAYLETPVREKVSEDKCDDRLSYGASSMQGWRISQEDAHTCLLDFDADTKCKTSMFAVYDGHGGAEVAEYTASHLPDFLKTLDQYKSGKLGQALEDGFLGFDATLVNEEVVTVLKDLAQTEPDEEENEEEQAQETAMLFEEASMPLEKLLERYSSGGQNKAMKALRKKEEFQSPAIKAKKDQNENNAADSNDGDKDQETSQMDEIKIKLDKQLTNGDSSEAVAQESDTDTKCEKVKNDTDADNDVTHSIDSTTNEETDNNKDISERKTTSPSAESSSSSVNGAIKVESPGEVSSSTEAQSTSAGSAGSASNVSCSGEAPNASSSIGDSAKSTVELSPSSSTDARSAGAGPGGSVSTSSSGSGIGSTSCSSSGAGSSDCTSASSSVVAGSSDSTSCSSSGAGGSSSASSSAAGSGGTGACSSAGGSGSAGASSMPGGSGSSQQDPIAGSSSGRTRKPRKNVIPGEDEDETSCSDDDDDDDEDDWETSEEEEDIDNLVQPDRSVADTDNLVQPDSEDDDMIEDAPCVHAHAHDEDEEEDTFMTAGEEPGMDSGCTAVVALVRNKELFVANAGDSRCVLCRAGKAVDMSVDHKPEDEIERNRIRKAGGKITMDGRVNGGLNLSRAIGDHSYKQKKALSDREQMITALPDIRTMTLDETDEFMVLACDGIWNVMSSQDVVTFVRERLNAGRNQLSQICEEMFDFCLAPDTMGDGTGCDNMTCVIVTFKDGLKSQEGHDRGEKRPADGSSDGDVKEPQTKRQKADDD